MYRSPPTLLLLRFLLFVGVYPLLYLKKKAAAYSECYFSTLHLLTHFMGRVLIHKFNIRFPPADTQGLALAREQKESLVWSSAARANHKFCAPPEFISVYFRPAPEYIISSGGWLVSDLAKQSRPMYVRRWPNLFEVAYLCTYTHARWSVRPLRRGIYLAG
jgi:hypothetical protein